VGGFKAAVTTPFKTQLGRVGATVLGVSMIVYGAVTVFHLPDAIPGAMIAGGTILAAAGLLAPYVTRISVPGAAVETREPRSAGEELAMEVEQLREKPPPDPAAVDLVGDDSWDGARYRLGERAIDCLLTNLQGDLAGCEARIFLFDAVEQKLMPAFRPEGSVDPAIGWLPGVGVTGVAYQDRRYAFATGDKVHDGTFGLSAEDQERFSELTAVAAVPLQDRTGYVFGTLSLSSTATDNTLTTEGGYEEHVALAEQISVALVDLIGLETAA
jgi:hypothetical protein